MGASTVVRRRIYGGVIDLLVCAGVGALFHPLGWLVSTGYWLLRDGLCEGQSIGKRLMGLKVVVGRTRERCTFKTSIIRNVLWVVPGINLLTAVTGVYLIAHAPAGRHWGDRLADTQVVKG